MCSASHFREKTVQTLFGVGLHTSRDRLLIQDSSRPSIEISGILSGKAATFSLVPLRRQSLLLPVQEVGFLNIIYYRSRLYVILHYLRPYDMRIRYHIRSCQLLRRCPPPLLGSAGAGGTATGRREDPVQTASLREATASLRAKILDIGGSDSSRISIFKGWNLQVHRGYYPCCIVP